MNAQFTRRTALRARGGSSVVRKSTPRWAPWRMVRPATRNTDQMPAKRVTSSPQEMLGKNGRYRDTVPTRAAPSMTVTATTTSVVTIRSYQRRSTGRPSAPSSPWAGQPLVTALTAL